MGSSGRTPKPPRQKDRQKRPLPPNKKSPKGKTWEEALADGSFGRSLLKSSMGRPGGIVDEPPKDPPRKPQAILVIDPSPHRVPVVPQGETAVHRLRQYRREAYAAAAKQKMGSPGWSHCTGRAEAYDIAIELLEREC